MSESMVERVARAICKSRGQNPDAHTGFVADSSPPHRTLRWEATRGEARAAIEAMREPTTAMIRAGAGDVIEYDPGWTGASEIADATWKTMITTALK